MPIARCARIMLATACLLLPRIRSARGDDQEAPKGKSRSTTARFVFSADVSAVTFECKLVRKPFVKCRSPRTYKKPKPGKHVLTVPAFDSAGKVSAVLTRKFTVLE